MRFDVRRPTCLHSHEDIPSVVRAGIYQTGNEAAYEQRKVGVLDLYIL